MFTRESLTPEKIAQLKSEHGPELRAVYTDKGVLVFKKPTRAVYDMWADKASVNQADSAVHRQLVFSSLAGVTEQDVVDVLDVYPELLRGEITSAIVGMCKVQDEALEVKKL